MKSTLSTVQATVIPESQHSISLEHIDPDALKIIHTLREKGYEAYLVGGSVRDLLVGGHPKDFDISTSAKPEEVKDIFKRNCLMIGRRFRLAHVRFGKKIFEVSTFRSGDNDAEHLIVRDNEWGTPEEDVLRRDFKINGLFFDPENKEVIDYVGGFEDIQKRVLSTIGDPVKRFKQDPVRMIRLLKFMARLGFTPDPEAIKALESCKKEIIKSAPARLLEEILRMLESGAAVPFFELLQKHGFMELLFPEIAPFLASEEKEEILKLLATIDQYHQENTPKKLRRSVLFTCLLFPVLDKALRENLLPEDDNPHYGKIYGFISEKLQAAVVENFVFLPKRLRASVDFILNAQYRFIPLHPMRKFKTKRFMQQAELSSALQFLSIRAFVDNALVPSYDHWKSLYTNRHKEPSKPRRKRSYGNNSENH